MINRVCRAGALSTLVVFALAGCGKSAAPESGASDDAAPAATASGPLAGVPSGIYGLDKTHGYITFSYLHLGFSKPALGFTDFDVTLNLNTADPAASSLDVVIDANSVYSRVAKFDEHLRSDDLFDTANYPEITFTAESIDIDGAALTITGPLTIKGIANDVTLTGTINKAANHPLAKVPTIGVSASAAVKRSDWGLTLAVPAVGDDVAINIEVELPLQSDE